MNEPNAPEDPLAALKAFLAVLFIFLLLGYLVTASPYLWPGKVLP